MVVSLFIAILIAFLFMVAFLVQKREIQTLQSISNDRLDRLNKLWDKFEDHKRESSKINEEFKLAWKSALETADLEREKAERLRNGLLKLAIPTHQVDEDESE